VFAPHTNSITSPIVGFIFDQKGLMYNLTLEDSKISRIDSNWPPAAGTGGRNRGPDHVHAADRQSQ
jgi:hypothetical protein